MTGNAFLKQQKGYSMSNNNSFSILRRPVTFNLLLVGILAVLLNLYCQGSAKYNVNKNTKRECFVKFNQLIDGSQYEFCITRVKHGEEYLYDSVFYKNRTDTATQGSFGVSSELDANSTVPNWNFQDINFDGSVDFCFYSLRGTANMTGQYWLYSKNGIFRYLGKYPALVPDSRSKLICSYERGDYAGGEYESKEYFFDRDSLVECRTLSQKFNATVGDTTFFILMETARPPCGIIDRKARVKMFQLGDSTVIDTVR